MVEKESKVGNKKKKIKNSKDKSRSSSCKSIPKNNNKKTDLSIGSSSLISINDMPVEKNCENSKIRSKSHISKNTGLSIIKKNNNQQKITNETPFSDKTFFKTSLSLRRNFISSSFETNDRFRNSKEDVSVSAITEMSLIDPMLLSKNLKNDEGLTPSKEKSFTTEDLNTIPGSPQQTLGEPTLAMLNEFMDYEKKINERQNKSFTSKHSLLRKIFNCLCCGCLYRAYRKK